MNAAAKEPWSLRQACGPGLAAIRANWAPFLIIQALAAVLVVLYYRTPALQEALHGLAELKAGGGIWFPFCLGFVAGGIIPEAAKAVTGKNRTFDRAWLADSLWTGFLIGCMAIIIDGLFRLQTVMFGSGNDFGTLLVKVAFDQFVFVPTFGIWLPVALMAWWHDRFRAASVPGYLTWWFYRERVIPTILPCWAYWIPVLFSVYAMPSDLQLCLGMLTEAAWILLFVFIAGRGTQEGAGVSSSQSAS